MSSESSEANCVQMKDLEISSMKQEQTQMKKATLRKAKKKYSRFTEEEIQTAIKLKKKVKQVTTVEFELKTSRPCGDTTKETI